MAETKLAPGTEMVTVSRLEIIGGQAYGVGTYPVPIAVKKEIERRHGIEAAAAAAPALPPPPASPQTNTANTGLTGMDAPVKTEGVNEQPVKTNIDEYLPLLRAAGVTNMLQLKGMNEEQLRARVPGLTPVGVAKVKEHVDQAE